jgi:hypothetical protein
MEQGRQGRQFVFFGIEGIPTCTSVNTRCVHSHSSDSLINVENLVSAQENLPKEGNNPVSVNSDLIHVHVQYLKI